MKIEIMSKEMAEKHSGGMGVHCISLTSSIETRMENDNFNNILRITVDDITKNSIFKMMADRDWELLNFSKIFDKSMLEKIEEFAELIKHKTEDRLIIHCSMGVSRSSAVACLVSEFLGLDYDWILADKRYVPNKHICNFLKKKSIIMQKYFYFNNIDVFRSKLTVGEDGTVSLAKVAANSELFTTIKDVLIDQLGMHEDINMKTHIVDDLGADSLDGIELIMAIEEEFEICIPDDEAEGIRTVEDAIDIINKYCKK